MIWEIGIWMGYFTLTFIMLILLMKFISLIREWKKDTSFNITVLQILKNLPFFIIMIPLLSLIIDLFLNSEGINDLYISTKTFDYLITESAPRIGALILIWGLIYILFLVVYDKRMEGKVE